MTHDEHLQDDGERLALASVSLSIELEEFLKTAPGRYLLGRAGRNIAEFTRMALDPSTDARKMEAAKLNAMASQQVIAFLNEAIVDGQNAEHELKALDNQPNGE